jgi:hypothetical protein
MIIKKGNQQIETNKEAAKVFLELAGGGYNQTQTMKAMALLAHYNREGSVKYKGYQFIKSGEA